MKGSAGVSFFLTPGIRTSFPIHFVEYIILRDVLNVFRVTLWTDFHSFQRKYNAGIVQEVPQPKITPPNGETVCKSSRRRTGAYQRVNRLSIASLQLRVGPGLGKLPLVLCLLHIELETRHVSMELKSDPAHSLEIARERSAP